MEEIPDLDHKTFVPRASTPLLDAIGRGINDLEQSLAKLTENERPSQVVMVIITDGHENASREFKKNQVKKMIKDKIEKHDWNFVFLSADMESIGDARDLGIDPDAILAYKKNKLGTANMWQALSEGTAAYRQKKKKKFGFDPEDAQ